MRVAITCHVLSVAEPVFLLSKWDWGGDLKTQIPRSPVAASQASRRPLAFFSSSCSFRSCLWCRCDSLVPQSSLASLKCQKILKWFGREDKETEEKEKDKEEEKGEEEKTEGEKEKDKKEEEKAHGSFKDDEKEDED
ncbi:E3 ubiquitin-protein ligase BRE1A-like [Strigops habroptila]|uniref:E3 ubiquitin-protein ligase BRE1A-like n=1 Tax=Strigops habroptila TaxID=2489341 RepID=UPI0011CED3FB|nr:E3 ubiquitin-protein ligase BRE1A-like [Strigops habroptila]